MSELPFAATTPIHIGRVGLRSRDASALADYYKAMLGLEEIRRSGKEIVLGTRDRALLEIEDAPSLKADDPRSAGLFHTAFLLPDRQSLARWLRHAIDRRIPITGASDHLVSEAIYMDDPDGNGIEIYSDRSREDWPRDNGQIRMATERLDTENLLGSVPAGDKGWQGAPQGTVVGHVHLRAGDVDTAEKWWHEEAGLDTMVHYGNQAVFMSSGGYHHHIANNIWHSRGAGPRDKDRAGLAFVEMVAKDVEGERSLSDPWGSQIRILPKAT